MEKNNEIDVFKLEKKINELDAKFNINHGGCCFVSYCIAKYCEKNNIKYKCCISNYRCKLSEILEDNDIENHQKIKKIFCKDKAKIKNFDCRLFCRWFGVQHFFIKIKDIPINKWIINDYFETDFDSKKLLELYKKANWNPAFDKNNASEIDKEIRKCFD